MRQTTNHKSVWHCGTAALAIALAASPMAAMAQDASGVAAQDDEQGLTDIIVTAQRREENLQKVPIAVSAVTAETLNSSGIGGTNALPQIVPSVQFTRSGPSGLFFIRGVGTTNAAAGEEGSNAFYVDGVYMPDLSQTINNFNNIERIEALKGPQGTLFGRNAFGGLVHIVTREPGNDTVLKGQAGYANYDTYSGQLYAAGRLGDSAAIDLALTGSKQNNGWGRNVTLNRETKLGWYWGGRSKIVLRPNDTMKLTLAGDYSESEDNLGLAWRLDDDFLGTGGQRSPCCQNTSASDPSLTALKTWGLSLTGELDIDFATLTSVTAIRRNDNQSFFDVDGGPLPLIRINYNSGSRSIQQEFRLASNASDPVSWQLGLFYLRSTASNTSEFRGSALGGVNAGQNIFAELVTDSYAAFGEVTYALTPSTRITGGLRFTEDRRTFNARVAGVNTAGLVGATTTLPENNLNYDQITYRLALRQDITEDVNVYASLNRGFKAGTYSLQSPTNPPVKPMFIMAYEVGLKSQFFDNRLRLNMAAFHYDISDYQVRSAATSSAGSSVLLNAADVKVDGLDVEFEAKPMANWRVYGGFTLLNSRFSRFPNAPFIYPNPATCSAPGTAAPGTVTGSATGGFRTCFGDATGKRTPMAPKLVFTLGGTYTVPLGNVSELRLNALYTHNSGYTFESDSVLKQSSYNLVNASAEYRVNEHWGVEVWGKNIGDTKWYAQKLSTGTGSTVTQSAPRTYGVSLKFDY